MDIGTILNNEILANIVSIMFWPKRNEPNSESNSSLLLDFWVSNYYIKIFTELLLLLTDKIVQHAHKPFKRIFVSLITRFILYIYSDIRHCPRD